MIDVRRNRIGSRGRGDEDSDDTAMASRDGVVEPGQFGDGSA